MSELELMLTLIAEQAPALFVVDGVGYEGHIESCVGGTVVAIARPLTGGERRRYEWDYATQVQDFGRADEAPAEAEDEDPMMQTARELAARAHEFSELSLAERMLRGRVNDGRS